MSRLSQSVSKSSPSTIDRPTLASSSNIKPAPALSKQRFDSLTALRFFPLFCVVFHHCRASFAGWQHVGESFNLSQSTAFFFVFSGFILAHNYLQLEGKKETWRFYLSRFSRIWPSHALCLFLLIALLPSVFKVTSAQVPKFLCNLFLVQAWIPSWEIFFSYNAPSWTCSTLVALYLCFPLLARAIRSRWYLVVAGAAGLVLLSIILCNVFHLPECDPSGWSELGVVYIHPISRLLEFVVGMVAALFFKTFASRVRLNVQLATALELSIMVSIVWLSMITPGIRAATIPLITNAGSLWLSNSGIPMIPCAALILILAFQRGLISKLLSMRFFIMLGEISFSMFLLHCVFLAYRAVKYPLLDSSQDALLYFVILFVSSYLMTVAFEKPVRKIVMKLADQLLFSKSEAATP